MADLDKNIIITPFSGNTSNDPKIVFSGADVSATDDITLSVLFDGSIATLSFDGSAGQLFSLSNDFTGTIFSVSDVSGIPSIEVDADGEVRFAEFSGNVMIGYDSDQNTGKLQINGPLTANGNITATGDITGASVILGDGSNLRMGSSDDFNIYYDFVNNVANIELEAAATALEISDNKTLRFSFGKANGVLTATSFSGDLTIDGTTFTTVDTAGQFTDSDVTFMTAAAINDHILSFSYSTTVGTVTSVTAGAGMTQTGTSTINPTLNVIGSTGITVAADSISTNDSQIVHDNLSGFVADEHIAHAGVTMTAGTGLTGGGTIAVTRTFNVIGGDGITANADDIQVDSTVVRTTGTQSIAGNKTFSNDLILSGNLTVNGTTTSVNTETLTVDDNIIVLNNNEAGVPSQDGGIEIERGTSTNVKLQFKESTDKWQFTNDGATYVDIAEDTDTLVEGSTNLYYSNARARLAISAGGDLAYNSSTGVMSFTNDAGDIESVTAGAGMTGGGTTGAVTLNVIGSTGITVAADSVSTNDSQIVHDNLSGFVADEHIAHAGVTMTAGTGMSGGGTIAATRTFNVNAGTGITVDATSVSTDDANIVHDNLSGFVANEHIDHSGVTMTAGTGMTGGGTLEATRTLNVIGGDGITANADDIQVDSTVIRTTGAQSMSGTKTFTDGIVSSSGAGLSFGNQVAASATDLSKHIALYATTYGISITGSTLNFVSNGTNTWSSTNTVITSKVGHTFSSGLTLGGHAMTDIQIASEATLNDTSLMTPNAINNLILDKNYSTTTGTVTSVTAGTGMTQTGTSTINPTLNVIGGDGITANANDIAVDSTVIRTTGTQTIGGVKTFSDNTLWSTTGAITIPSGTTGERPTPTDAMFRYNATLQIFEGYTNASWSPIGGNAQVGGAFVHNQAAASTTWTVAHNLGVQYVNVEPIDSSGNSFVGKYNYPDINFANTTHLILTFTSAQSGNAAVTSGGGAEGPQGDDGNVDLVNAANDVATTTLYPVMVNAAATNADAKVTTTKLSFNALTGALSSLSFVGNLSMGGHAMTDIQIASEATLNDTSLMTPNAINNLILDKGYSTTTGTVTSVTGGSGLTGSVTTTGSLAVGAGFGITVNADNVAINANTGIIANVNGIYANHDAALNFNSDEHIAHSGVTMTAGTGMTGGGAIDATRTLNVIGGDGITANANDIQVDSTVIRTTGAQSMTGQKTFTTGLTLGGHAMTDIQIASEAVLNDTSLMTPNAINNLILDKGYSASSGTVTSVTAGTGMTQTGTSTINPTLNVIGGDGITANANDIAVDSTVVRTTGTQSIAGVKTFSNDVNILDGLVVGSSVGESVWPSATPDIQLKGVNDSEGSIGVFRYDASTSPARMYGGKSRGALGIHTIVANNDQVFEINAMPSNGANFDLRVGSISFNVDDAAPDATGIGGELTLNTSTAAGAVTEAIRISSTQSVHLGSSNIAMYPSNSNVHADFFIGTAVEAQFADVAERYETDKEYEPGTVLIFGGDKELTESVTDHDHRVAGVVSTAPAIRMNSDAEGQFVALTGRIPVKVIGPVNKGDLLTTSNVAGRAKADNGAASGRILGKAIESTDKEIDIIEVLVNLM